MTDIKNKKARVLIVDDDNEMLVLLSKWLTDAGYSVDQALSGEEAYDKFMAGNPSLIVTDLIMEGMDGLKLLGRIHRENPLTPVIMLSGKARIPDAVKATHLGSSAFLTKPIKREELLENVRRYVRLLPGSADTPVLSDKLVYQSKVMQEQVELARLVAESNVTVLLTGATGTGKEVIARGIHDSGPRADKPFIAINCGALPEQLLESELFGHVKGAFSGAVSNHEGLFQAANGGTLFLDEIGDMPLTLQVKLLRVLQDFQVRQVGSVHSIPIDVRIITATHQDLDEKVARGEFREDLYYRLNVVPIHIPDLSQRREDIPLLAEHFLEKYAVSNDVKPRHFSPDAMEYLVNAPWPGNIRQLMNVIALCSTLSKTATIPRSLVERALQEKPGKILPLKEARQEFEKNYLISVLRISNGHVANAAKLAGRNRTEFYKLLATHGLDPAQFRKTRK